MGLAMTALREAQKIQRRQRKIQVPAADRGINTRDLPNLIDIRFAVELENMTNEGTSILQKTKGIQLIKQIEGVTGEVFFELYSEAENIFIAAHNNKAGYFNMNTEEIIYFKTDFATEDMFSGIEYGGFFYLSNGGNKIGYADGNMDLDYDNLAVGTFTAGNTLQGTTRGATGKIDSDNGSTAVLSVLTGNFIDNEFLQELDTDGNPTGVTASADGVLKNGFTIIADSNCPKAKHLFEHNARLFAGNTDTHEGEIRWSEQDDGTGTPFTVWTPDLDGQGNPKPASAASSLNRSAGPVNSIGNISDQIIGLYDAGKIGFRIEIIDVGSVGLAQKTTLDFQKIDFGAQQGAISTSFGIFYKNKFGLFWLRGGLEEKIDELNLTNILGDKVKDYSFSDGNIEYLPIEERLIIPAAKNSDSNNTLLYFDLRTKAIGELTGIKIGRLLRVGETLYGTGIGNGKIYQLFEGNDFEGSDIWTKYVSKNFDFGDEDIMKTLRDVHIYGKLSAGSEVNIYFDIWDENGFFQQGYEKLTWSADAVTTGSYRGYSKKEYNEGPDSSSGGMTENVAHGQVYINRFRKFKIRIEENSKLPFEIHKIVPDSVEAIRRVRKGNLV